MVSHVLLVSVQLLRVLLLLFLLLVSLLLFFVFLLDWFHKFLEFVEIIRDI